MSVISLVEKPERSGFMEGWHMAELEMMTVKEVADYLKMKPVTIYKLAKEGRIPAFKVASFWRFKKDLIEKWAIDESKKNLKPNKRVGEASEV